jgi:hypothetical protein
VEDGEESDVGFSGAGGGAEQEVLVRLQRRFVEAALDAVQGLEACQWAEFFVILGSN